MFECYSSLMAAASNVSWHFAFEYGHLLKVPFTFSFKKIKILSSTLKVRAWNEKPDCCPFNVRKLILHALLLMARRWGILQMK